MLIFGDIPGYVNKSPPTYRDATPIPQKYAREPSDETVRIVSSRPRGRPRKPEPPPAPLSRCAGPNCIAPATQGRGFVCSRHWYQLPRDLRVELIIATGTRKHRVRQLSAEVLR